MKKIIALLLALVMVLGLAACGETPAPVETQAPTDVPVADKGAEAPKSNAGLIIGIVVGVLAIGAAVFFVIKKKKV